MMQEHEELHVAQDEPELCFSQSEIRDPAFALLDSGATHILLPGIRYLEEHVHSRSLSTLLWAKRRLDAGEMKYLQKTEHIHFFF